MKTPALIFALGALGLVNSATAQLAPVNEMGLSIGHLHLAAPDREREAKAWLAMGGQLENNLSGTFRLDFRASSSYWCSGRSKVDPLDR